MTMHDYTIELCYELAKLRESNLELRQLLAAAVRWNHGSLVLKIEPDCPTVIASKDCDSNFVTITLGNEDK